MKLTDHLTPTEPLTAITIKIPLADLTTLKNLAHKHRTSLSAIARAMIQSGILNETAK